MVSLPIKTVVCPADGLGLFPSIEMLCFEKKVCGGVRFKPTLKKTLTTWRRNFLAHLLEGPAVLYLGPLDGPLPTENLQEARG